MRILLISNQGMKDGIIGNPIMLRMRNALKSDGRIKDVFMLRCKNPFAVRRELREYAKQADIIHIHFGGVYALIVWFLLIGVKSPKLITFHGTDIHAKSIKSTKSNKVKLRIKLNQWASFMSLFLFDKVGFVASDMLDYVPNCLKRKVRGKVFIQKLGVDYNLFVKDDKMQSLSVLNLDPNYKYILFSDISDSSIKRRDIAQEIVEKLGSPYRLNIMCGVTPNDVPLYINASDFLLLTSDEEGSPNIIRECLSLDKPIFSVNVGDVKMQIEGLVNSSIISRKPDEAALRIKEVLALPYTDNTREKKRSVLDINILTKEIVDIYQQLA